MRKLTILFAALTLSVGLWAVNVGEYFKDATSGLWFEVTSATLKTVKVIPSNETGTACEVPATVSYNDVTFAVTEIGEGAFQGWESVQSITLPESVTTIGEGTFMGCGSLISITIPVGVTTIEEEAFNSCSSLASVTVSWTSNIPTPGEYAFEGIATPAILHVPAGTAELYETAGWDTWFTIEEPAATSYTRDGLSNGKIGTICLAYAVENLEGVDATFYKLNYFDGVDKLYLEPVTALAAGMPYIFEAKAESFTVNLTITDEPAEAGNENGLYGALTEVVMTSDATHSYAAISNNQVTVAPEGNTVSVAANRAYIDMNEVSTTELVHKAPLRALGIPRQMPTELETVDGSQCTMHNGRYLHNGQLIIVKDGKKYNALGF